MNIKMAAVAACALTLGITPAKADIIGTISALPSVIQAGETTHITLSISGDVYDPHYYLGGFYWEAEPWDNEVTFYDGLGGSESFSSISLFGGPIQTTWSVPVIYPDAGTFSPYFDADIRFRLTRPDDGQCATQGHAFCLAFARLGGGEFSTSVTVNNQVAVPGPIIGGGLPGLLLAGLLFIYRRRSKQSHSIAQQDAQYACLCR